MGILKQSFSNIQCDFCGCLCSDEWFPSSRDIMYVAECSDWYILGDKCYCPDCWKYDENANIVTADGKLWNGETKKEIIKVKEE